MGGGVDVGTNCKQSFAIRTDLIIIQYITMKINYSCVVEVDGGGGGVNERTISDY